MSYGHWIFHANQIVSSYFFMLVKYRNKVSILYEIWGYTTTKILNELRSEFP